MDCEKGFERRRHIAEMTFLGAVASCRCTDHQSSTAIRKY